MDLKQGKAVVDDVASLKPYRGKAIVLRDEPSETYEKHGKIIIPDRNRELDSPDFYMGTVIALGEPVFHYQGLDGVKEWPVKVGSRVMFKSWGRGGELDVEILGKGVQRCVVLMLHELLAVVEE